MVPESHETKIERRYRIGERDYEKLIDNVMNFANEHRLMEGRKLTDMDIDSTDQPQPETPKYTAEEWEAWQNSDEVNHMGKAKGGKFGKGKGKGKDGTDSGGGKDGKGKGKDGKETRICNWCQKTCHLIAECRAKAAGTPKVKPAANAARLDEKSWAEDVQADGLDCAISKLQCDAVSCCQERLDFVHEYNGDDADEGGELVLEPVLDRKPFLDQFKIHTQTLAASSQPSSWSSPNSGPPASPLRDSFEDSIRRMQEELKMELEAMKAKPLGAEPPGLGGKQRKAEASPKTPVKGAAVATESEEPWLSSLTSPPGETPRRPPSCEREVQTFLRSRTHCAISSGPPVASIRSRRTMERTSARRGSTTRTT